MSNFGHSIHRLLFWTELRRTANTEKRMQTSWVFSYPAEREAFSSSTQMRLEKVFQKIKKARRAECQESKVFQKFKKARHAECQESSEHHLGMF